MTTTEYDIALSFAGEDRDYVDQVANYLRRAGVSAFYDKYERVDLWGKDLYEHLSDIYRNKAAFTVMFISMHYAAKVWPRHERRSAQARALRENREYILPAGSTILTCRGLLDTIGYLDLREFSPAQLAEAICEKLVQAGVTVAPPSVGPSAVEVPAAHVSSVLVTVRTDVGEHLDSADLLLVASNGTHLRASTNLEGTARFEIAKRRTLTAFCAHPGYPAFLARDFDPVKDLVITVPSIERVGSLISLGGHDRVPGLKGTMNSIHDSSNRLYVYTKNIAVDGGKPQPISFGLGKALHFEDVDGHGLLVTFVAVIADCFLVEYRRL